MDKLAFLDRDGTLNIDKSYIYKWSDFEWIPGVKDFIRELKMAGYFIYIVSNQAGIAKGLYGPKDVIRLFRLLNSSLFNSHGVKIDDIRFCPHHPEYSGYCNCRKPELGMFNQLIRRHKVIDKKKSFMVGDHNGDYEAGRRLGLRSFLLQHEFGHNHPHEHISKSSIINSLKEIEL